MHPGDSLQGARSQDRGKEERNGGEERRKGGEKRVERKGEEKEGEREGAPLLVSWALAAVCSLLHLKDPSMSLKSQNTASAWPLSLEIKTAQLLREL